MFKLSQQGAFFPVEGSFTIHLFHLSPPASNFPASVPDTRLFLNPVCSSTRRICPLYWSYGTRSRSGLWAGRITVSGLEEGLHQMRGSCMPKQCGFNNWEAALILSQLDLYPIWDGPLKWTWPFMRQVACHHTSVIRRPLRLTVVSKSSVFWCCRRSPAFCTRLPLGCSRVPRTPLWECTYFFFFFFKLNLKGQHFICNSVGGKDWPHWCCWVTCGATDVDFQWGT